jgi:hypothetical protein
MKVCVRTIVLAFLASLIVACATDGGSARPYLTRYGAPRPDPASLAVCWGYGCRLEQEVDMTAAWAAVEGAFVEPAASAAEERARIAEAVALWERAAAEATPIGHDRGGTFEGVGEIGQLDCVDETINTTRFLVLLEDARLLRFHRTRMPDSRGAFVFGWPHTTAVLVDKANGERFAIDSWFHDNGRPAEVVPIELWKAGWAPDGGAP